MRTRVDDAKDDVRTRVWARLDEAGVALPPGAAGRIPNFSGAGAAAELLAQTEAWRHAAVVKANPDKAQHPVRVAALRDGKTVFMAVPKLATAEPFYRLVPAELTLPFTEAARSEVAAQHTPRVPVIRMPPVDLVLCGSVAVNRAGTRLGKGAGYSDIEVGLLTEAGLIGPATVFVTTVHSLQVLDEDLPESQHDFRVDIIVTPDEVIQCRTSPRPRGIYWDHLSAEKIAAIPALQSLAH